MLNFAGRADTLVTLAVQKLPNPVNHVTPKLVSENGGML